jgi:hypothetical protein
MKATALRLLSHVLLGFKETGACMCGPYPNDAQFRNADHHARRNTRHDYHQGVRAALGAFLKDNHFFAAFNSVDVHLRRRA